MMDRKYQKIHSKHLGQDFEFISYGHAGKPVIIFPCSNGRFYDYENFGMFPHIKSFIEAGDIIMFAVDGRDWETYQGKSKGPWMGQRQRTYELCIVEEVIPYIMENYNVNEKFMTTGNSWGAYHAINFLCKFPGHFDSAIALSGSYSLKGLLDGYYDNSVYYNDITMYLPNLNDEKYLTQLRDSFSIICHGQGAWEMWNHEARAVVEAMKAKKIPHWYDVWGYDVAHDWPWWKKMMPYFLGKLKGGVEINSRIEMFVGPARRIRRIEKIL